MEKLPDNGSGAVDTSVPVLKNGMATGAFLVLLRQAASRRFTTGEQPFTPSRDAQLRRDLRVILLFEEFLGATPLVNPDESLLSEFLDHLITKDLGNRKGYWAAYQSRLRCTINALPSELRQRVLLSPSEVNAGRRLSHLTAETQEALDAFLKGGKKIRNGHASVVAKDAPLTDATKKGAISALLLVMNALGVNDIHAITDEKLGTFIDIYSRNGKQDAAQGFLADVATLFRNLVANGTIPALPSLLRIRKPVRVNRDYVSAEGIAKLQDLGNLDLDDFASVRDRMITFVLFYDFGLRQGEAVRLNADDIAIGDGCVDLNLRGSIQKGQNKPDAYLGSFFPASLVLVKQYLALRHERQPRCDALLISMTGERLLESGCNDAVKEQCEELGVRTFKGNAPSCHKFRHAFGTLNIDPLGLGLSLYEIMERLRHEDVQTTRKIYIDSNPLIQRERHMKRIRQNGSFASVWPEQSARVLPPANEFQIPESDALGALGRFGLKPDALRKAAESDGACKKRGSKWFYAQGYIDDLNRNWVFKQEAAEMLGMTDKQLWHWLRAQGIAAKVIGKASLLRSADILKGALERHRKSA